MRATSAFIAALVFTVLGGISACSPAAPPVTIFDTKDFHADRARWTDPAYFKNKTVNQLRGMALNIEPYGDGGQPATARLYNTEGTAKVGAVNYASPYPFKTAREQYDAWLAEANGGTKHTKETIPDWSGRWNAGGAFGGGQSPASDIVKYLTPQYQEYFVQEMKAYTEGRIWSANSFCLPTGFFGALPAEEFVVTPEKVWTFASGNGANFVRWIYTDGSGVSPPESAFPKWHGESMGFWNGDTLIVYTNQIRGWKGGISEYTDALEIVEKYRRVGDKIEADITMYDPTVFAAPMHTTFEFELNKDKNPAARPTYNTCTDTNGPAPKVYLDDNGFLNEHLSGEGNYQWDVADPRPWGTFLNESDKRFAAYIAGGGKPHE